MSDIDHWPAWNHDVSTATLDGGLKSGSIFKWKAGPGTITSTLEAVETKKLLAWSGKTFGIKALHIWHFEAHGASTLVTTEESWDGLPVRLLKASSKKMLVKAITSALQSLKQAAEQS